MKYIAIIFLVISFLALQNPAYCQKDNLEKGIRFLKLGNSYRVDGNYAKAEKYLERGFGIVSKLKDKYWQAVYYEYQAHLYCDQGNKDKALSSITKAVNIYQKEIKQKDGSQVSAREYQNFIKKEGCPCSFAENGKIKDKTVKSVISSGKGGNEVIVSYKDKKLRSLPTDIPDNVTTLDLSGNNFKTFPAGLEKFKKLRYLDLSNNKLRDLTGVGSATGLHWLNLSNNSIIQIPDEIGKLSNLNELILENNKIKKSIGNLYLLKQLKYLNIKGNKLAIGDLETLIQSLSKTEIQHDEYMIKEKGEE